MKTTPTLIVSFIALNTAFAALPSVGPDYRRPDISASGAYRDAEYNGSWKTADPADALSRGAWWKLFHDPVLDALEDRALAANQDLRASAARVEQARALAGYARGAYWPQIAASGSVTREQTSEAIDNRLPNSLTTTYRAPLSVNWELDLFGRVRRLSESAKAEAAASVATFEAVRLALTADVASQYFSLRAAEDELRLVTETVNLRRRALDLVSARRKGGAATDLDLARAETELATTEAEAAALANRKQTIQNALAVLVGEAPNVFALQVGAGAVVPPSIPAGVPSDLLERRPDVAAAERTLAAANARIGVAKAAFFPAISLTGSAGYASADLNRLVDTDSRVWSIGPSLYLPIFQGGRNRANLERSRAAFDEAVAAYRQRVLVALREVQDALSAARWLDEQSVAQTRASTAAERAASLAQVRYDAGFVSYLEVIDAQRTALGIQRATTQLNAQRLNTSVALIKALGGGWSAQRADGSLAQR